MSEIRTRIDHYFNIVLRNVKDSVPKAIGYFLVKKSQDTLQFELYNAINSNKQLQSSLGEPARITERRKALKSVFEILKGSLKVLQRDPDISSNTTGDEELEAMLRAEAQDRRKQPPAGGQASNRGPPPGGNRGPPPGGNRGPPPGAPGGQAPGGNRGPPPGHPQYRGPPPGHPQYRGPPPGAPGGPPRGANPLQK